MKMTPAHFDILRNAIAKIRKDEPDLRMIYTENGHTDMRFAWDMVHRAKIGNHNTGTSFICKELYPYLNDTHIETALRKIIDMLWRLT